MTTEKKWGREEVLAEARRRVSGMVQASPDGIQKMLESLVLEAGWDDQDLLNVLIKDVVKRSTRPAPRLSGTQNKITIPRDVMQKSAAGSRGK